MYVWNPVDVNFDEAKHESVVAYKFCNPVTGELRDCIDMCADEVDNYATVRGWRRLWWSVSQQSWLREHIASGLLTSLAPELEVLADSCCGAYFMRLVNGGVIAGTVPMTVDVFRPLYLKCVRSSHPDKNGGAVNDRSRLLVDFKKLIFLLQQEQECQRVQCCAPCEHDDDA